MRIALTVLALCGRALVLPAQEEPPLKAGARVRVTLLGRAAPTQIGRYQGLRDTTVLIQAGSSLLAIPRGSIERLELSGGRRSQWIPGAGAGLVVGAGVAFVLLQTGGSTSLCDRSTNQDAMSSSECLGLTALGGMAGAGLGATIGALVRTERWQDIALNRLQLSLSPQPGRTLHLAVAVVW